MAKKKSPRPTTPRNTSVKPLDESAITALIEKEVEARVPKVEKGLAVAMPNTTRQKMDAICELSRAVSELATALNSVHTRVEVSHCNFQNHTYGIKFESE